VGREGKEDRAGQEGKGRGEKEGDKGSVS